LATSVWMGYADSQKPLTDIKGVSEVFGGTFPAMTWKDYMSQALGNEPDIPFPPPGQLPSASTTTRPGSDTGGGTSDGGSSDLPPYDPTATTPAPVPTRPPRPAFSVPPYSPTTVTTTPSAPTTRGLVPTTLRP